MSSGAVNPTLSAALKVLVTAVVYQPKALGWVVGPSLVMVGGVLSCTVTVKESVAPLFAASVAVQVTVVVPKAKVEPLAGVQLTVGLGSTASVAVGLEVVRKFHLWSEEEGRL